ncbi:acetyltransferase [Flavobacterium aquatile]|uniref:Acetyltransferase n=1 Tax=Flavobacterium aquatile LMG 4008 = ATCC 11947 TaxID=1453498 RepID=A0A095SU08_9FLAO|nr:acetyltransferase [Flavobacterium aquatile]KGD68126.1 acetyltransferase [Flavobacterium aquatile LMG 4008 = ATCC 11947]OXA68938.1 acetyltransferase [Flavobacterium aquatile] [Flavobacterium aquatile LMG 4008 = ATCC 11947]GEC77407.1 transferase [Flavobacterium aquatile]
MEKIVIVGAGGFGREVKMLIDQINRDEQKYEFLGYYDDGFTVGSKINNNLVLGSVEDLAKINNKVNVVVAIGAPEIKRKIVEKLSNPNINFPTLMHPSVLIGNEFVSIGTGCIICAGTIITCNIDIKDFVILNLMCTVGHDTIINSFASFMPSVNISGEVVIHEEVYVGTGAKIINQLEIGRQTIIGAGAVVSKTLPEKCTAVGIPAKPIKFHD